MSNGVDLGISAKAGGKLGNLLANVVNDLGSLLGDVLGQGNSVHISVGNAASVAVNATPGTGTLAQVSANTSGSAGAEKLTTDVQGLLGDIVGGVVSDLGSLLGGLTGTPGMGTSLSVGNLISIGINATPVPASLLTLDISAGAGGLLGGSSSTGLGGGLL